MIEQFDPQAWNRPKIADGNPFAGNLTNL